MRSLRLIRATFAMPSGPDIEITLAESDDYHQGLRATLEMMVHRAEDEAEKLAAAIKKEI